MAITQKRNFFFGRRQNKNQAGLKKKLIHNNGNVSKGHRSQLKKLPMAGAGTISETK